MAKTQHLVALAAVASLAWAGASARAAVPVPVGGVTEPFNSVPASTEWSTLSIAGSAGDIDNTSDLDTAVSFLGAFNISNSLGTSSTSPPSTNAVARYNFTHQYLQTRPTGNGATLLMATLQNATGDAVESLDVSYDFSSANVDVVATEEVVGQRVYYSPTGFSGSWIPIGNFSSPGRVEFTIAPSQPWADGSNFYLLWADDNADGFTDGSYHIDNITFDPVVVPEPAALGLIALVGLPLLGGRRRR